MRFSPLDARIFNAVWIAQKDGGVWTPYKFMAAVYADEADGGAENPSVIAVRICAIRKRLAEMGFTITKNEGTPRVGYRIVKLDEAAA